MSDAQVSFSVVQGSGLPKVGEIFRDQLYPQYEGWVVEDIKTSEYQENDEYRLDVLVSLKRPVEIVETYYAGSSLIPSVGDIFESSSHPLYCGWNVVSVGGHEYESDGFYFEAHIKLVPSA